MKVLRTVVALLVAVLMLGMLSTAAFAARTAPTIRDGTYTAKVYITQAEVGDEDMWVKLPEEDGVSTHYREYGEWIEIPAGFEMSDLHADTKQSLAVNDNAEYCWSGSGGVLRSGREVADTWATIVFSVYTYRGVRDVIVDDVTLHGDDPEEVRDRRRAQDHRDWQYDEYCDGWYQYDDWCYYDDCYDYDEYCDWHDGWHYDNWGHRHRD